jgi:hypothetical protein
MSIILGLPWLYSRISIRKSAVTVGDVRAGETIRDVVARNWCSVRIIIS